MNKKMQLILSITVFSTIIIASFKEEEPKKTWIPQAKEVIASNLDISKKDMQELWRSIVKEEELVQIIPSDVRDMMNANYEVYTGPSESPHSGVSYWVYGKDREAYLKSLELLSELPWYKKFAYNLGIGNWFISKSSDNIPITSLSKTQNALINNWVISNVLLPDYYNTPAARSDFYATHEGEIFSDTEFMDIPLRSTKSKYEIIPGSPVDKLRKINLKKAITPTQKTLERAKKLDQPYIPASSKDSASKALKRAERFGGYQ